jgi:hypothetical protein
MNLDVGWQCSPFDRFIFTGFGSLAFGNSVAACADWRAGERRFCSVRSRSEPEGLLTVTTMKPTFLEGTIPGPNGSDREYS